MQFPHYRCQWRLHIQPQEVLVWGRRSRVLRISYHQIWGQNYSEVQRIYPQLSNPQNITDARSWFGCINQVSYSFASAPIMSPFRHLLSSKVPFAWYEELQTAFEASKQEIVNQCEKGVRSFNPSLPTALTTDWSKLAIGFWLTQKH